MIDRSQTRDTPRDPAAILETANLFGTRVAEPILAGGHVHRHQQTGHMIASDPIRSLLSSCKSGAVHIWVPAFAGTSGEKFLGVIESTSRKNGV